MRLVVFIFAVLACVVPHTAYPAVMADTLAVRDSVTEIDEVVIMERRNVRGLRSTAPLQVVSRQAMMKMNVFQVSDAVKHFGGVTVKDYGGIGGLKTVSVRSLGAAHTAVSYDGITISDCQTGQIDIGRFSLDNVESVSLWSGQSDDIFMPARQMGAASLLDIRSLVPEFVGKPVNGRVALKGGSFGLVNPSLYVEGRLSGKLSATFSGEWMGADGQYPYLLEYGESGRDSSSMEVRRNTDVQNLRLEGALFGRDSVQGGHVKLYYFQSERGLPGATIFYNTAGFSSQRLWERTLFAQGHYERRIARRWTVQANAKYNYSYSRYLDPTALNVEGKQEDIYRQQEFYASFAAVCRVLPGLSFSAATDGAANTLTSNERDFANPVRFTWLTSLAGKYVNDCVLATASILMTSVNDVVERGEAAESRWRFSPYASVSVKPWRTADFRIRLFYKNVFRMPTFNDLYYSKVGEVTLRPEVTDQFNVGLTYRTAVGRVVPSLSLTCDVYHNSVKDKIVAYPTKNIYQWSMVNYGRVSIDGMDFTGEVDFALYKGIRLTLGATYTYCMALDVTDPDSRTYRNQIPYTPRMSGSGRASLETPWFYLAYSLVWSGARYSLAQNYAENRLPGYADHSLSAGHDFKLPLGVLGISAECLNLTGKNYAVVRYFPMPGRSWRATVNWKF